MSILLAESMNDALPQDVETATLVGRVFVPEFAGPATVVVRGEHLVDISASFPTMTDLTEPVSYTHLDVYKRQVHHLTRSLAAEWHRYGIRVNAVAPGYVATDLLEQALEAVSYTHLDVYKRQELAIGLT